MTERSERPQRRARAQAVLNVRSTQWRSPHVVRLVAGGSGFDAFHDNEFTDKYVKILFVDPALNLMPPYDLEALRASLAPEQRPVTRTYTVRRVEAAQQQLTIDFVTHGDDGVAAPWAAAAKSSDLIVLSGAGGGYRPDPALDWHLFAGDESAIPAVCAALEVLPADARGIAYLERIDEETTLDVEAPAGIEVVWLDQPAPGSRPDLLASAIDAGRWLNGRLGVFAHGERESMKRVRAALKPRLGETDVLSLSGYWAYGRTEDVFQAEKREPIGQLG